MAGGLDSILDGLDIERFADWQVFVQRLEKLVQSGRARRAPKLRTIFLKSEEWYLDTESGDVYVYVQPDAPMMAHWEKVDVFAKSVVPQHEIGLGSIPRTKMTQPETLRLKEFLKMLVHHRMAEVLDPSCASSIWPEGAETLYKDLQTNLVYRLIENMEGGDGRWERVVLNKNRVLFSNFV